MTKRFDNKTSGFFWLTLLVIVGLFWCWSVWTQETFDYSTVLALCLGALILYDWTLNGFLNLTDRSHFYRKHFKRVNTLFIFLVALIWGMYVSIYESAWWILFVVFILFCLHLHVTNKQCKKGSCRCENKNKQDA
jgi:hypothetical protein